jgi:hypothetical protein
MRILKLWGRIAHKTYPSKRLERKIDECLIYSFINKNKKFKAILGDEIYIGIDKPIAVKKNQRWASYEIKENHIIYF